MRPKGPENLIGFRSDGLLVLERVPGKGQSKWKCICDCGKFRIATRGYLTLGKHHFSRCSKDCILYGGNKRTKQKECKYCGENFLACDSKASICEDCKNLERSCLCGCGGLVLGVGRRCLPGHYMRIPNSKILDGLRSRSNKIKGENNPAKRCGNRISESLLNYWKNLSEEERQDRLENNYLCNNGPYVANRKTREDNSGFLSSWEKQVAVYLTSNGISRCHCDTEGCDKGWHYEVHRKFWNGRRYFPDFTYRSITIEVIGFSYMINPEKCLKKMLNIIRSGYTLTVVTSKEMLISVRSHELAKVLFQEEIGIPIFTLDKLDYLLSFIRNIQYDPTYRAISMFEEV